MVNRDLIIIFYDDGEDHFSIFTIQINEFFLYLTDTLKLVDRILNTKQL